MYSPERVIVDVDHGGDHCWQALLAERAGRVEAQRIDNA
jgi:hypothetical protein